MATWDSYTQKSTPADNDTLMIKDTSGGANKRTPFSGVWNWILTKLTNAVISQLETTNKSIIPAINELNSKSFFTSGGIALTGESDFNNYMDFGNYYCAKTSDVALMKNKPKNLSGAFSMKIFAGNGTRYPTQQLTDLDGNMWIRSFVDDDGWRAWSQFSRVKDS